MIKTIRLALAALLLPLSQTSFASDIPPPQTMTHLNWCVFDVLGANGPAKKLVDEYRVEALRWGLTIKTEYFSDDMDARSQFEAGRCDMVNLPDFRARKYNRFTGSINAIGSIPDYHHLKILINTLARPDAANLMKNGDYEIIGIAPIGGIHFFVNDRTRIRPETLVGLRMSTLEGIEEVDYLTSLSGIIPVYSNLDDMFNQFKNKLVDATASPLIAYEGLEMYKGLEPNGGISRYPFSMLTMQLIVRSNSLPEGVAQKSREHVASDFDYVMETIKPYTDVVPDKYWYDIPLQDFYHWDNQFSKARKELSKQGIYDAKMLQLLKKIRCQSYPDRGECHSADSL